MLKTLFEKKCANKLSKKNDVTQKRKTNLKIYLQK